MGTCSSSVNHQSEALPTTDSKTNGIFDKLARTDLENKISDIINIDIQQWKLYIKQFNEPISADQLQIWSRQLKLIATPPQLTNIDNLLRIRHNIYSIEPSKYKSYLINFIKALLKKPNQNRVILVDLIYLLKICQDDLLSLYATLQIFYDIGFRTTFEYQQPCLIFNYKDVSHCKSILFWLQLHCKINLHSNSYSSSINIIDCYKNYEAQLISFIAKYCSSIYTNISLDIIRLLSRFVVIDFEMTDSWGNYIKSIFSFHPNTDKNIINLNVFDMQRNEAFDIEIRDVVKNKNITDIHEMIVLKNQSVPNWIKWHYKSYDIDEKFMQNNNELTSIYITYNNVARATDYIVFNKYDLCGYRFKKDKNCIMSSYKGIYHPLLHKLICLDGKYLDFGYLYDIDTNQYLQFKLNFKCDVNNDFNACLCDSYSKLFYCSAEKTLIVDIDEGIHHSDEKNIFENFSCGAKMLLNRSGHSLLYHDKLAQIIIGGGYEGNDVTNNLLSGRTIEMYDIYKDCWNLIDIKTNYIHNSHPSLWYDLFNPFIINIENNDFYSSEFIDIRQQKQWHKNYQRKNFLQQFKNKNTLVFS